MDEDTQKAVTACAEAASALGVLFTDIVCMLAEHPGVDKRLLLEQVQCLYAPVESSESFQIIYNNYRERAVKCIKDIDKST
ncbi:MAG: hypothetical protein M0042_10215 [Nitrospiraceae bacterium]|nr:hypothetical protein [Nitrospiraceae bacterium]